MNEIKYVFRLLRDRLFKDRENPNSINQREVGNHDECIAKNFWGYVKNVLSINRKLLPTFDRDHCTAFFLNSFSACNKSRVFCLPKWIPLFAPQQIPVNLEPPSYQQITNIIRNMKSSGSPCPLDQLSIICFKRCPYLRSYITDIIKSIWSSGIVPYEWKKACTVLAHKKGDTIEPANFRPITLESVPFKIFTSALRNSIFAFQIIRDSGTHFPIGSYHK